MNVPFPGFAHATARVHLHSLGVTERTVRWFLESGIQLPSGGVARYYRADTQNMRPVSSEITGYAAAFLTYLHDLTGNARCQEAAVKAARFLTRTAWNPVLSAFSFEVEPPGASLAYFFDSGIIVRGLLALWRATGDEEFRDTALGCAQAMARDFRAPSGYHPILSLVDKRPIPAESRWSRNPGCYQLKAAMAWLEVAEATGEENFISLYEAELAGALRSQAGFLDAETDQERVMDRLHAYCYFLEGLLPRSNRPDCAAALCAGIVRVKRLLDKIGPSFERCDVVAQLLRVRLYASALHVAPLDTEAASAEAAALGLFQYKHEDPRVDGAFCFGRRGSEWAPYANPVSTAFSVQALEMWRLYQAGEFKASVADLI